LTLGGHYYLGFRHSSDGPETQAPQSFNLESFLFQQ